MADPTLIEITPIDTWKKVATNVTTCRIIIKTSGPDYFYTYVENGNPAPSGLSLANSFDDNVEISHNTGVDVYIYARGAVGSVEVQA